MMHEVYHQPFSKTSEKCRYIKGTYLANKLNDFWLLEDLSIQSNECRKTFKVVITRRNGCGSKVSVIRVDRNENE